MKRAIQLWAAAAVVLIPTWALACPYAYAGAGDCGACSPSSTFGYGASLLLGLGVGFASVAFERRRRS